MFGDFNNSKNSLRGHFNLTKRPSVIWLPALSRMNYASIHLSANPFTLSMQLESTNKKALKSVHLFLNVGKNIIKDEESSC
jgi:hypothetical protein